MLPAISPVVVPAGIQGRPSSASSSRGGEEEEAIPRVVDMPRDIAVRLLDACAEAGRCPPQETAHAIVKAALKMVRKQDPDFPVLSKVTLCGGGHYESESVSQLGTSVMDQNGGQSADSVQDGKACLHGLCGLGLNLALPYGHLHHSYRALIRPTAIAALSSS